MTLYEIVRKLNGPISAVGETNADNQRYENLVELTELVNLLLTDIDSAARSKNNHQASMAKIGKFASDFFDRIGIHE